MWSGCVGMWSGYVVWVCGLAGYVVWVCGLGVKSGWVWVYGYVVWVCGLGMWYGYVVEGYLVMCAMNTLTKTAIS